MIRSQPFIIKCSSAAFSRLYGFCFHFKVEFPSKIKLQMGKSNYVDIADFSSILFSPSLAFPFPILISLTVRSWKSCFLMKAAFCSWAVPIIITITSPLDTRKRNVIKKISECLTGYNLLFFSFSITDLFGLQPLNQRYPDIVPTISWQCSNSAVPARHARSRFFPAVRATWHHATNKAERELSSCWFDECSPLKHWLRCSTLEWLSNSTDLYISEYISELWWIFQQSMKNLSSRFSVLKIMKHLEEKLFKTSLSDHASKSYLNSLTLTFKMSSNQSCCTEALLSGVFSKVSSNNAFTPSCLTWMRREARGRVRSADGLRIRATFCR